MVTSGLFLGSFTTPVEHGLIYIRDRSSRADHLGWDPTESPCDARRDSIALAVCPGVDGVTGVEVWEGDARLPYEYFDGMLETPSQYLCVHDADDLVLLTTVVSSSTSLRVSGDEPESPRRVMISLRT